MAISICRTRISKGYLFHETVSEKKIQETASRLAQAKIQQFIEQDLLKEGIKELSYLEYFSEQLKNRKFLTLTFLPAALFYVVLLLFANPFLQFIIERILQSFIVIVGVATLVFTILYLSPLILQEIY